MKYLVLIEPSDNGYAAYLPDLPGCIAAGDTLEETKNLIAEAIASHLEMLSLDSLPLPEARSIANLFEVSTNAWVTQPS